MIDFSQFALKESTKIALVEIVMDNEGKNVITCTEHGGCFHEDSGPSGRLFQAGGWVVMPCNFHLPMYLQPGWKEL